jgi:hypothetical protein
LVRTCDLQAMKAENKRGIIGPDSRSWYAKVLIDMEVAKQLEVLHEPTVT